MRFAKCAFGSGRRLTAASVAVAIVLAACGGSDHVRPPELATNFAVAKA